MRAAEGPLPRGPPEFDVCIAGGTLGIFVALALQQRGHKVCVVEKRLLQGRTQEWNISRAELDTLIETGLLTEQEVDSCITTAWDADRIQFKGAEALWVSGVLNIGVSPRALIAAMRRRFLEAGGTLLEHTAFKAGAVHSDGVEVQLLPSGGSSVSADEFTMTDVNRPSAVARSTATTSAHSNGNGNGRAHPPRRQLSARLFVDCMG